jgi:hypothetical protein
LPDLHASDGNDADHSAAGETTEEAEGTSTGLEDERSHEPHTTPNAPADAEEEAQDSDMDDELDEEARHQLALRERMAKLSGGMGMPGMFGIPGAMPMPGMRSNSKKKKKGSEKNNVDEDDPVSAAAAPRIPIVPVPGLNRSFSSDAGKLARSSAPGDSLDEIKGSEEIESKIGASKGNGLSVSPIRQWPIGRTMARQCGNYSERSLPDRVSRSYESKGFAIQWILCSDCI